MKQITNDAVTAFFAVRNFKRSNTEVVVGRYMPDDVPGVGLYLHGNLIARHTREGMFVRHVGWRSNTTKERLNGVLLHYDKHIRQKNFEWLLCGRDPFTGAVVELPFDSVADENGWVRVDQ